MLGKYIDPDLRPTSNLAADMFIYDVPLARWTRLSADTRVSLFYLSLYHAFTRNATSTVQEEGGPQLIYDHQMCIDSDAQVIYVFGGRTITASSVEISYSGLYSYDISAVTWRLIR